MNQIGKPEITTQSRVIKFFHEKLKYRYIGDLRDQENRNIDEAKLKAWLVSRGNSEGIALRAVEKLVNATSNLQHGLYAANKEVCDLFKSGMMSELLTSRVRLV